MQRQRQADATDGEDEVSKPISPAEHHYRFKPFRYCVMHFGPNRAQRRSDARRDPCSSKLQTPPPVNVPYITPPPPTEESTDA